jgi:UDP-N-acetyl-D-galactosamine dehydrogenase
MVEKKEKICVVGLGYVGLPLAVKFGQVEEFEVFGLDLKEEKIKELKENFDSMGEVDSEELEKTKVEYTTNPEIISKSNFIVVAVPTPIDDAKNPDITLLKKASEMIGNHIQKGSIVVYESTVYPGCTEEDCVPIIEKVSGLRCGVDWFVGYSPERVNPGDKEHTIDKIVKVVSGMNGAVLDKISEIYSKIIAAGIFKASSIKVAEAAKVIENSQRDLNIAFMNELTKIFDKMNIPIYEVLEAASTKWNFLNFKPGLVGGHCIGVDPYYLIHKAKILGEHSQLIGEGRKINDEMPIWVSNKFLKILISNNILIKNSNVIILGLTFKENVPDYRNSKAKELIKELKEFGINIYGYDPYLNKKEVMSYFGVENLSLDELKDKNDFFDGAILVTPHKDFLNLFEEDFENQFKENSVLYDIKNFVPKKDFKKIKFYSL